MSGEEMPPSWTQDLCRRKGVLAALDHPGPRHRYDLRRAGRRRRIVHVAADDLLGAGAVVRDEENQRVLEGAHRLDLVEHAADLPVHAVDHRGVDRHLGRLESLLLLGQVRPGHGPVHLARTDLLAQLLLGEVPARNRIRLQRRQIAIDHAHRRAAAPIAAGGWRPSPAR